MYGAINAREVVEKLIVSDGQPKRGFRSSVFSDELKICGIATGQHKAADNLIQIDYANKLLAEGEAPTINVSNPEQLDNETLNSLKKIGIDTRQLKVTGVEEKGSAVDQSHEKMVEEMKNVKTPRMRVLDGTHLTKPKPSVPSTKAKAGTTSSK